MSPESTKNVHDTISVKGDHHTRDEETDDSSPNTEKHDAKPPRDSDEVSGVVRRQNTGIATTTTTTRLQQQSSNEEEADDTTTATATTLRHCVQVSTEELSHSEGKREKRINAAGVGEKKKEKAPRCQIAASALNSHSHKRCWTLAPLPDSQQMVWH